MTWALVVLSVLVMLVGIVMAARQRAGCPVHQRLAAIAMIAGGGLQAISSIQGTVPVVQQAELDVLLRGPQQLTVTMWADKVRDCRRLENKAYVIGARGAAFEAAYAWLDDPTPGDSRPMGWQNFGITHITWPRMAEPVVAYRLESWHDCGRLMQTVHTVLGPFPVPAEPLASGPTSQATP